MADFEDNFEQDPAAEFLQREQSALAGLEDEIPPVSANIPSGKFLYIHNRYMMTKWKLYFMSFGHNRNELFYVFNDILMWIVTKLCVDMI